MLKYALLGFLSYRPMSGYDIEAWMNSSTSNFWHAKLSQIYTTLKKMEEEGLVTSHIEPQDSRPDRRVYTLTGSGHADLQDWLTTPITERETKKDALLLKVFFGLSAGKTHLLTQLRLQLDLHKRQKNVYENETAQVIQQLLNDEPDVTGDAVLWELTRHFGEMYEDTYIRWLEEAITTIEQQVKGV